MIAWEKWAGGETPEISGIKGDHLVGKYYVKFEDELKRQSFALNSKENLDDFSHYTSEEEKKVKELNSLRHILYTESEEKNNWQRGRQRAQIATQ